MNTILQKVQSAGVVGAGGAGFPSYIKLDCQVDLIIVNAAECEPLLNKDQVLIQLYAQDMLAGVEIAMQQTGAKKALIGIKEKHQHEIEILQKLLPANMDFLLMPDVYPAGDEVELIFEATGQRVPSGGLPKDVGVLVHNVESFINIYRASQDIAVTHTMLSVHGDVVSPYTAYLPIGISYREALQLAGGIINDKTALDKSNLTNHIIIQGGPMMGNATTDLDKPIVKLSSGLIVISNQTKLAQLKTRSEADYRKIGKAACDQCSLCTSMCPRHLLGYPVMPHLAMRALQLSGENNQSAAQAAQVCCECNLCSVWACPEGLDPRNICATTKRNLREQDLLLTPQQLQAQLVDVHPMREYRRVPTKGLVQRLGLNNYIDTYAQYQTIEQLNYIPRQVTILLSQHIGKASLPIVEIGARVKIGQCIAKADDGLSVGAHASIDGTVTEISDKSITIKSDN